jgi:16S rRNA G966 N2-methylase RsmD
MEAIYRERAKQRQLSKLKDVKDTLPPLVQNYTNGEEEEKGKVATIIAKKIGLSPRTYEMVKVIIEKGTEEVKTKLRNNQTTISKEYKNIQKDIKRNKFLANSHQLLNNNNNNNSKEAANKNVKLIHGDFTKLDIQKLIPPASVDLTFTDPPYGNEYLYLYEELAKLASRVLKPNGSLVFFVGHIILADVFQIFQRYPDLKYWWTFAVKHSGHHTKIHPRHVFAEWKPLLWFVKGDKINNLQVSNTMGDYIESVAPSKVAHDWQQSPEESAYIIKNLTIQDQIVLDPMMGTGTTGLAALQLKRKFIGIEKDLRTFEVARAQLK